MASKQAGWRIYKQQMGLLDHGDALWEPAPIYSYKRVKLGDVGYIRRGRFHLLFSAGCPLGSREPGVDVPLTFEPLDVGPVIFSQPRLPGYLSTNTVKETGAGLGASVCAAPFLEPGVSFSFELTEKQGAALVTKYRTYREDIELESAFEEYTKRHYDSWVTFARNARHGNDIKPVLVTGVDMTRDFAMIAYSNNSAQLSSEFSTSVPLLASASASAWGTWHTKGLVHTNCGPQLCSPPSSPEELDVYPSGSIRIDVTPNEYNQCVFIRYYTMRRRALMFPKVIKAGAGPHDLGSGDNHDETFPELTVQMSPDSDTGSDSSGDSTTDYSSSVTSYDSGLELFHNVSSEEEDTFDVVAEWVFRNSEAEAVLIHHNDVTRLREGIPGTDMSELFSVRQPAVVVDSAGVGKFEHRSHHQPAATFCRAINPSHVVSPRHTPDLPTDQSSVFSIRLNAEDSWTLSRGLLLLLATHSKSAKVPHLNAPKPGHVMGHFSHVPITGFMSVGEAGIAGMFMGCSIKSPIALSLLAPLSLAPSSWQFDLTLALLQGEVPEETLLVVLAEEYLGDKSTDHPPTKPVGWGGVFSPVKHTGGRRKHDAERRYSLPQPREVERLSELISRPQSFWSKPQQSTREEFETALRGWSEAIPTIEDPDASSLGGNNWRHSARSVTSSGGAAGSTLHEPRSRPSTWYPSDRSSLNSDFSSSSVFTRSSGTTTTTSLTALPSGTISKRSSQGSVLQREKRFSKFQVMDGTPEEMDDELSQPGTPGIPPTPTLGGSLWRSQDSGTLPIDTRSTHTTEHGVLPPPPKLHGRKYAASLTSLLWKRESSDETRSTGVAPMTDTSSRGRRARFKRYVKGLFGV